MPPIDLRLWAGAGGATPFGAKNPRWGLGAKLWSVGATPLGGLEAKPPGGSGGEAPEKFSGFYVNLKPGEHL